MYPKQKSNPWDSLNLEIPTPNPSRPRPWRRRKKRKLPKPLWALLILLLVALFGTLIYLSLPRPQLISSFSAPYVIALDAGHGGNDQGAEGIIPEVSLTEATVKHLYSILESDANFQPLLCREYGLAADTTDRTKKARASHAALLLSVHGNASDSASISGFECFPTPPGRKWHQDSLRFATLVAEEMAKSGSKLRGEGGVRYLYYEKNTRKLIREISDTQVYTEPSLGMLEKSSCPAVLIEQCFITNKDDVQNFGSEQGCKLAAESYYRAICQYFGTTPIF